MPNKKILIKYKILWELLFLFLLFLYIYSPRFIVIGGTTKIFIIMIAFYFLLKPKIILEYFKSKTIIKISSFLIVISLMTLIIPLFHQTYDFSFSKYFITALVIYLPLTFYYIYIFKNKLDLDFNRILKYLFIISLIQSIFILLNWYVPSFKVLIVNLLTFHFDALNYYRATGISYGTGDGLSFIQAIGFMSGYYLLFQEKRKYCLNIIYLFIIFISMIFVGRTGIILAILFVGIYTLYKFKDSAVYLIKLLMLFVFFSFIFILLVQYFAPEKMTKMLHWAFEFYFSYVESGKIETSSTNALLNMFFLPNSEISLFFGDGYYMNPYAKNMNYIHSDSGYIRTIFFGGFLTMSIIIFYFIYLIIFLKKLTNKEEFIFILLLFLIYFIGHLKVPMLYYGTNVKILFILIIVLYFDKLKKKEN